ncbi:endonuclease Q family protein [Patescibacteria group bacterium]|nr:endonuclease Q family protein [Patescibacteria group bacterium]MBU1922273.1 endonuclease Q family protein [Patescibacteria group bacterium]
MRVIADLHIHSKYSRSCSQALTLENIAKWCEKKGIDLVSTADFTHPAWFGSIKSELVETAPGIFMLKNKKSPCKFILGTEISCIYSKGGQVRRLHHCVYVPDLKSAEKLIKKLESRKCNLHSDGRPIIGMPSKELLKILLDISESSMLIPAHAWTPWFAIFGSKSGYDSIEQCFEELSSHICAIETGLSSDPAMNRRLSGLDNIFLVSNSDAHSSANLGREANVFDLDEITYENVFNILRRRDAKKFLFTIEFYPEEGKYHFDGHRECKVRFSPAKTKKHKGICPECGKKLTLGVMNRVDNLADRKEEEGQKNYVPFKSIVPLDVILSEVFDQGKKTKKVLQTYEKMIAELGPEFEILLDKPIADIESAFGEVAAQAIQRVRDGKLIIEPGYDGEYGTVKIFSDKEKKLNKPAQKALF